MSDDPRTDIAQQTTDQPGYKIGKAIWDGAKTHSRNYTSSYEEDQKFFLGENQWPKPTSYRAARRSKWKNQSVRNYLFSTIRHKMAVVLDAEPEILAEPLNEQVTLEDRNKAAWIVKSEFERMGFSNIREDVFLDGAVLGKGIVHWYHTVDPLSGLKQIAGSLVDPNRFYPDTSANATRIKECRYLVYEPELDMADCRRIFPETYRLIQPRVETIGKMGSVSYSKSADELIYGAGTGELTVTSDGMIQIRKADVAFVYIGDPTIAEELKYVLESGPERGYKCQSCGASFAKAEAIVEPMNPQSPACPTCLMNALEPTMLPPVFQQQMDRTRAYPYGRLIALTENALLYDGQNEEKLRAPHFPFSEYGHYRINRRFWKYGDVALAKTVQQALNKNMSQAIDNLRMNGNAPLEFPAEVPAYRNLGTQPGDTVPCPASFMGMARFLPTNSYAVQLHQIIDDALKRDMQEITNVSDVARGITPSAPTSGKEVQVREQFASQGIGLHRKEMNEFESDSADIVYQMARNLYTQPRAFKGRTPQGDIDFITEVVASLPADLAIRITADVDRVQKDNLLGQNVQQFVMAGGLDSPYADILLKLIAKADRGLIREFEDRRLQLKNEAEEQALLGAQAAPEAELGVPSGAPGPLGPAPEDLEALVGQGGA